MSIGERFSATAFANEKRRQKAFQGSSPPFPAFEYVPQYIGYTFLAEIQPFDLTRIGGS